MNHEESKKVKKKKKKALGLACTDGVPIHIMAKDPVSCEVSEKNSKITLCICTVLFEQTMLL